MIPHLGRSDVVVAHDSMFVSARNQSIRDIDRQQRSEMINSGSGDVLSVTVVSGESDGVYPSFLLSLSRSGKAYLTPQEVRIKG